MIVSPIQLRFVLPLSGAATEIDPAIPVSTIPQFPLLTDRTSPIAHADAVALPQQTARLSALTASASWSACGSSVDRGTAGGRLQGILDHQRLPQPLLGLLTGYGYFIALLLGLLPAVPLDRQFILRPLERLLGNHSTRC